MPAAKTGAFPAPPPGTGSPRYLLRRPPPPAAAWLGWARQPVLRRRRKDITIRVRAATVAASDRGSSSGRARALFPKNSAQRVSVRRCQCLLRSLSGEEAAAGGEGLREDGWVSEGGPRCRGRAGGRGGRFSSRGAPGRRVSGGGSDWGGRPAGGHGAGSGFVRPLGRSAREVPGGGGRGEGDPGEVRAAATGRGGPPGAVRAGCEAPAPGEPRAEGALGAKFSSRGANDAQKRSLLWAAAAAKKVLANGRAGGMRRPEGGERSERSGGARPGPAALRAGLRGRGATGGSAGRAAERGWEWGCGVSAGNGGGDVAIGEGVFSVNLVWAVLNGGGKGLWEAREGIIGR